MSSHLARFGTLPRATFLMFRFRPTGATVTAKWRMSISFVTGLYEKITHRLIVDKFTVAKLIVGNMFWNVCAINFKWFPSPVKLFKITCNIATNFVSILFYHKKIEFSYQWWMLECRIIEVLFFHRCQHVSGQRELMNSECERGSFGQSRRFEWQLIGRFVENHHMRHMEHARQTNEILDAIFATLSQRCRRKWFHHSAKISCQKCNIWKRQTTMDHKRMRCI